MTRYRDRGAGPIFRRPLSRCRRNWRRIMRTAFVLAIGIAIGAGYDRIPSLERIVDNAGTVGVHAFDRIIQGSRNVRNSIATIPNTHAGSRSGTSGTVRVVDGDTIDIAGSRIRLHGIDAPESSQGCMKGSWRWNCGQEATAALRGLIARRPVSCATRGRDRYGRDIAVCTVSGADINAWMVRNGWALAYRRYSLDYVLHERWARDGRLGIWQGKFVKPWDWRRGKRIAGESGSEPARTVVGNRSGKCAIKGNINSKGTRIYHIPGGDYYDATRINTRKGERWFCTEAEARAAGWRRSRR